MQAPHARDAMAAPALVPANCEGWVAACRIIEDVCTILRLTRESRDKGQQDA